MTQNTSRVLSVCYGSFSVRVEGFDDPFAIMKRVTEYFQTLAAMDPNFGALTHLPPAQAKAEFDQSDLAAEMDMDVAENEITVSPKADAPAATTDIIALDMANDEQAAPCPLVLTATDAADDHPINEPQTDYAWAAEPLDLSAMAEAEEELPFVRTHEAQNLPKRKLRIIRNAETDFDVEMLNEASAKITETDAMDVANPVADDLRSAYRKLKAE